MKIKRMIVGLLCACMILGTVTGCSTTLDTNKIVITVNGTDVNLGTFMTLLRYQEAYINDYYTNMYSQYEAQGMVLDTGDMWDGDPQSTDDEDAETSGMKIKTYGDEVIDDVAVGIVSYLVAMDHADEYDVSLSDADNQAIDSAVDQLLNESDKESIELNGITKESATQALQWYALYVKIYDAYCERADITISEEESKNMTVSYMQFSINSDSELYNTNALVKKQAEQILATLSAKEDLKDIDFNDFTENYTNLFVSSYSIPVNAELEEDSLLSEDDVKAMSELKDGEIYNKVVGDGNGAYYIFRVDSADDRDAAATYAETLRSEKAADAFLETLKEWTEAADVEYRVDVLESISVVDRITYTGIKEPEESDDVDDTEDAEISDTELSSDGVEIQASDDDVSGVGGDAVTVEDADGSESESE